MGAAPQPPRTLLTHSGHERPAFAAMHGLRPEPLQSSRLLCAEDEAGPDRGMDHFGRQFGPHQVIKSLPGTMARYQIIRVDLLKSRDDLPDVLVGQRRHDVEAANDRMDLLNAGSGLRLSDCIDDAAMTAGCQHDQSLTSDDEVRSDLVLKIIGNEAAGIFCRRNLLRETSETVDDADLLAARS